MNSQRTSYASTRYDVGNHWRGDVAFTQTTSHCNTSHLVLDQSLSFLVNFVRFLAFPLYSNVDASRNYFVVIQNWRIPPQNGSFLEELSSSTEELFFPCQMTWYALQWWSFARTLGYFVYWSVHLCLSSAVQDTTPEGILSSCGCSLTLTLTISIGIW